MKFWELFLNMLRLLGLMPTPAPARIRVKHRDMLPAYRETARDMNLKRW